MGAQVDPSKMSHQDLVNWNLQQRQLLIATAPVYNKNLGVNTQGTLGGSSRIKLYNVGLLKRLIIQVSCQVDIGTATATAGAKSPYNLINRLRLTDYSGTDRVNISGMHLFMVNCARYRTFWGYNNESATPVLTNPTVPTTVGTNQTLNFFLEVPVCYSDKDLRGIINMQSAVGEMYLQIDWNSNLVTNGSDDAVYNGGGTTTVALNAGAPYISVTTLQEYFAPQANPDSSVYFPQLDAMTIYELQGVIKSSDNIAANQERLLNLQNLRSVIGFYLGFLNNGVMDSTSVSQLRFIVNGNNVVLDRPRAFQLMEQRRWLNSDSRAGQFFWMFRDSPVETAQLGNAQIGFTPSSVTGTYYLESTTESFYMAGQTLPGMNQAQ